MPILATDVGINSRPLHPEIDARGRPGLTLWWMLASFSANVGILLCDRRRIHRFWRKEQANSMTKPGKWRVVGRRRKWSPAAAYHGGGRPARILAWLWWHPELGELDLGDALQHLQRRHVAGHHHLLALQIHLEPRHPCSTLWILWQTKANHHKPCQKNVESKPTTTANRDFRICIRKRNLILFSPSLPNLFWKRKKKLFWKRPWWWEASRRAAAN